MTVKGVGDRANIAYVVTDPDTGALTAATVALAVTDPSGVTSNPSITNPSTGVYHASFDLDEAGVWSWVWTASGTVVDRDEGSLLAGDPQPPTYATLSELKTYIGESGTTQDAMLLDALETASREIEHYCRRRFWPSLTAAARVFEPRDFCVVLVDDFWTSTGLVVKLDSAGDGTYAQTLTSSQYQLEPLNGINDGEIGWPYYRLRAVGMCWPSCWTIAPIQVTAKWGWAAVPAPVHQACIHLAEEVFKLKGSPFGVAGDGQFGPIRIRENQRISRMLAPYVDMPVLVG